MKYSLFITGAAEQDLEDTIDYIENTLKNGKATHNLLNEINEKFTALISFPYRYPLCSDPILSYRGIRHIQIKNHIAFYKVSEEENKVILVRFLYAKRNWEKILKS